MADCLYVKDRASLNCDEYHAPSLWCDACFPRLAKERGIDVADWPERRGPMRREMAVEALMDDGWGRERSERIVGIVLNAMRGAA